MLAVVALFVTSCVQSDVDGTEVALGQKALVSLSVETSSASSRTIADGTKATNLQYAVYEEDWTFLYEATETLVNLKATLELELLTGYKYHVVLWADANTGCYDVDFANKKVDVSYDGAVANDESRDAFYAVKDIEVKGTTNTSVQLKRPFAQINFGASDLVAAQTAGFDTANLTTNLTVTAYEILNFVDGSVEGKTTATFAAAAPQSETATLTAGGKNYDWISMNYVLCPNADASLDKCTMVATDGTKTATVSYPMAPARRNWKTNLVGSIFTDSTKIEVEVTPGTDNDNDVDLPDYVGVNNATLLQEAIDNGEEYIKLTGDIDLNDLSSRATTDSDPKLTIASGKNVTIDLNGMKLSATSSLTTNPREMFLVKGNLTVNNGTIEYKHVGENMAWNAMSTIFDITAGGVVTLNEVVAKNLGGTDMTFVVHLNNWGEVTLNVNNSTLEAPYIAVRAFNSGHDMNNVTIKNSTLKGKYCFWVHNYTLVDFGGDEAKTAAQQALLNLDIFNGTNTFEYTGKAPILYGFTNSLYYGVPSTGEELNALFSNGVNAILANDIETTESLTVANGNNIVLDLNGHKLSGTDNATGSFGLINNRSNLTVVGPGKLELTATNNRAWNAYSSVISNNPGGDLVVKGGVVIEHLGGTDMAYGIDNLTNGKGTVAVTTIEDATVKSPYRAVRQFLNGVEATNELYVKAGAVIEGVNKSIWMQDPSNKANTGKLVVEAGAQLKGNVYLYVTAGSTEWPVEVSIAKAALVDGSEVLTGNVPTGYMLVEENDNYVVKAYEVVAEGVLKDGNNYLITAAAGLTWFSDQINNKKNTFSGKTITVINDIDMAGVTYYGGSINSYPSYCFKGIFDGGEKVISNLTITVENDIYGAAALIPTLAGDGTTIKNVILKDVNISSSHYAGGIWGYTTSDNCWIKVTNCRVEGGTITGNIYNNDNADKVGGIGGIFYTGTVSECLVKDVTISGYRDTAGIVGWAADTRATVKNNTLENVTINVNNTNNYKNYTTRAQYDVNSYVGEGVGKAKLEGNTGEATINWGSIAE